ncbi:type I deoxyribonuclease HsdR [Bifidobacterium ramosum]|uniref:Type I restriction enzyme endonuclease subunit n=1 Tax=Bifidobacterium ramosum TaxID=1798158 RepID=A0A6L4WZV4_9BIFI|nr:type I restriction endonuclease subunit R [Bifidobacterium ramosum]KAB8287518.1 type I deoxyribonuclease HsdR [Bifidobacterium ramosum]NEG72239.1 HsdR family type I site-specific deoxyribonuclease [Bifidobacterium ramosum]
MTNNGVAYVDDGSSSRSLFDENVFERAIIGHLKTLGYDYLYGPDVSRTDDSYRDVMLPGVLESSLQRINPQAHPAAIEEALRRVANVEGIDLLSRNVEFTDYMQSGIDVSYFDGENTVSDHIKIVDFDHPERNTFTVVNQWTYVEYEEKRPDLIIFINGMPMVIFELKSPSRENVDASDAYRQLRNYMKVIPTLFVYNAFCVMTDMADTRVGTITANEDRFMQWKTADGDYSKISTGKPVRWTTMLDGMLPKERLLDILRNFICFSKSEDGTAKILAAYHQYFGVHKAIESTLHAMSTDGKAGVFWHTQGSGKSLSMVFYAHLLREQVGSPTIVVTTDRTDLDGQLYGQFAKCKDFLRQTPQQATSRSNLIELLNNREANGIVFTTMQKFSESDESLSDRRDIVVMADEAHRSQYGLQVKLHADGSHSIGDALKVRQALPNASYIGFTGTPIETQDKSTREIFGDYVDVYDMTQSVEDGATRPVFYESRVVALKLDENVLQKLDEEYANIADDVDELAIDRSKHDLATLDSVLGASETIDSLCRDIVHHYEENRADELTGKALVVAYSRTTAMKMYDKFLELRPQWKDKVHVVMTSSNQDPEEWHTIIGNKAHKLALAKRFKDDDDPFKIAIVVDMWLTGFDVPSLSTMYVYKPMKGHNLMQAVARVNRVYKGKEGGLIVDYIGIAGALKRAMHDYTKRDRERYGDMNVADTAYPLFLDKLGACRDFLHGLDYQQRIHTDSAEQMAEVIADGADYLLDPEREKDRKDFVKCAKEMAQAFGLCRSMVPDDLKLEEAYIDVLRTQLLKVLNTNPGNPRMSLGEVNKRIAAIMEQGVHNEGVIDLFEDRNVEVSLFDESFLAEVAQMKQKNLAVELLHKLIDDQVKAYRKKSVVKAGKFSEMLQQSVNAYLNGMLTNAEVIQQLLDMAKEIMAARQEGKTLGLDDEELAFYDALTKPQAIKDFYDNDELVAITRELTDTLRKNRTIDWQKKEDARARMRRSIKRLLKKHKYPPDEVPDAIDTVMQQCELWADYGEGN